jgi:hypothetical protein
MKCGSRWTDARVCILLFSNLEGEVCLSLKLHGARQRSAAADAAEKEKFPRVLAVAKTAFLTAPRDLLYGWTATSRATSHCARILRRSGA